jgi:quinol monooxygenase YgiN
MLLRIAGRSSAQQRQLLDLLDQATAVVRLAPGFISANLHRSLDGTKVAMYAQWQSAEHYQAMRENPAALAYLQRAVEIAKFEPGMYEVVETYSAPDGSAQ